MEAKNLNALATQLRQIVYRTEKATDFETLKKDMCDVANVLIGLIEEMQKLTK